MGRERDSEPFMDGLKGLFSSAGSAGELGSTAQVGPWEMSTAN